MLNGYVYQLPRHTVFPKINYSSKIVSLQSTSNFQLHQKYFQSDAALLRETL